MICALHNTVLISDKQGCPVCDQCVKIIAMRTREPAE